MGSYEVPASYLEGLSFRALERVRSAILITDPTSPDNPIIYANPAFETLTGYSKAETVGRNCRFLQGADRNQPSRAIVSDALARGEPVQAVLRNYRSDGSLFYNELFIDPVFDTDGMVVGFVGCQNAIAEPELGTLRQQARERAARLTTREAEVLRFVASGFTNTAISEALQISARTVEKHRTMLFRKFGVRELALLVRFAVALGVPLVSPHAVSPSRSYRENLLQDGC